MITTGVQTRKKDKDGELKVFDITELPEEYLRTEYREEVRESLRNRFIF
jgi:hypothetical protein